MSREITLGDRVRAKRTLKRVAKRIPTTFGTRFGKAWEIQDRPIEGIIVGKRTLPDGFTDGGYDEAMVFVTTKHTRVVLVAYSLHRKPMPVLLEDLQYLDWDEWVDYVGAE